MIKRLTFLFSLLLSLSTFAQEADTIYNPTVNYASPKKYEIGGVTVSGIKHLEGDVLKRIAGLKVGEKINIPGEKITKGIQKLYKQGLFSDIDITATKLIGNKIFLNIHLPERPRLFSVNYVGLLQKVKRQNLKRS